MLHFGRPAEPTRSRLRDSATFPSYFLSEEDCLAAEHQHQEKHEWHQGECFAMAGGTRWHNLLASRILTELARHLDGKECTPYMADLRLLIEAHRHYVYPDVMVICTEAACLADDMANDAGSGSNPLM